MTDAQPCSSRSTTQVLILLAATLTSSSHASEPKRPIAGNLKLASGRPIEATFHYDRNAIRDSHRVGDSLIALTSAGTLLRLTLPDFKQTHERLGGETIQCLGQGEGDTILAGFEDGTIVRVDPETLDPSVIARLSGTPSWIGWVPAVDARQAGLVAITTKMKRGEARGRDVVVSSVIDPVNDRVIDLEQKPSTVLLDGTGRLWLGVDRGEWGGQITRIELESASVRSINPAPGLLRGHPRRWEGIYGFFETQDGEVWAFGGTSHMGVNSAMIARIDGDETRMLLEHHTHPDHFIGPDRPVFSPTMPITQILERDSGFDVFSYNDVFRVDRKLTQWSKVANLSLAYRWGRPDALGSYPSLIAVHPPVAAGKSFVLATALDGYFSFDGTKATSHALQDQLGASSVTEFAMSSEGFLAYEGFVERRGPDELVEAAPREGGFDLFAGGEVPPSELTGLVWKLGQEGWDLGQFAPAYKNPPEERKPAKASTEAIPPLEKGFGGANDEAERESTWNETRVIVGPGGVISTVSRDHSMTGVRTTTMKRVDGANVELGSEWSDLEPSGTFVAGDGSLWNTSSGELHRFRDSEWESVGRLPFGEAPSRLTILKAAGPPWLFLDPVQGFLWFLEPEPARLIRIEIKENEQPLNIRAGIPEPSGSILLATHTGLRSFDPGTRLVSKVSIEGADRAANALTRDRNGRLWIGGNDGLRLVEPGGKPERIDILPWLQDGQVTALTTHPEHDDGVVVSLGQRGLAFVRAGVKP